MSACSMMTIGFAGMAAAAIFSAGCSSTGASPGVSSAPTVGEALGESACGDSKKSAFPLLVDMKDHDRAAIELSLADKLAVVHYDCERLEVLPDCTVPDAVYGYVGFTPKERVLRLTSKDEISANLPILGVTWASNLEGQLAQGSSLDVALVSVGTRTTTLTSLAPEHLSGSCDGATHFIRRAYAGAFAVDVGETSSARVAAEVFGVGTAANTEDGRFESARDGDIEACKGAKTTDESPPEGCAALLRVELVALTGGGGDARSCPGGMVFAGDKCTAATPWANCQADDEAACRALCDDGELPACVRLGDLLVAASKTSEGREVLKKACDEGDPDGCHGIARLDEKTDPRASLAAHRKACDQGSSSSCDRWAELFEQYERASATREQLEQVLDAWQRACNGGSGYACERVALHYVEPDPSKRVVEPDEQRALEMMMQRCLEHPLGCSRPALLLEGRSWCELTRSDPALCEKPTPSKRDVPVDIDRAKRLVEKSCQSTVQECALFARQGGLDRIAFDAAQVDAAATACAAGPPPASSADYAPVLLCAIAAAKDPARATEHRKHACALEPATKAIRTKKCAKLESANERHYCWLARIDEDLVSDVCGE